MKRTPFYRRPGKVGKFSGLRERVIWMIQTRGRPVTGSEIAEKFGVTLVEFNRVANGITKGEGRIAQLIASETWLNDDGICDRTFDLITRWSQSYEPLLTYLCRPGLVLREPDQQRRGSAELKFTRGGM